MAVDHLPPKLHTARIDLNNTLKITANAGERIDKARAGHITDFGKYLGQLSNHAGFKGVNASSVPAELASVRLPDNSKVMRNGTAQSLTELTIKHEGENLVLQGWVEAPNGGRPTSFDIPLGQVGAYFSSSTVSSADLQTIFTSLLNQVAYSKVGPPQQGAAAPKTVAAAGSHAVKVAGKNAAATKLDKLWSEFSMAIRETNSALKEQPPAVLESLKNLSGAIPNQGRVDFQTEQGLQGFHGYRLRFDPETKTVAFNVDFDGPRAGGPGKSADIPTDGRKVVFSVGTTSPTALETYLTASLVELNTKLKAALSLP